MALFTAVAVLGTLVLLFIIFSKWRYQYWSRKGVAQLEPTYIFGDLKPIFTGKMTMQDYFMDIYKRSKAKGLKMVGLYTFLNPELMVLDLDLVKRVFLKDFDAFPGHGLYKHEDEPLTMHLFSTEGEEWKKLRAKLTPTFTSGKMKMMLETVLEKANKLRKVVDQHAASKQKIHIKETLARFGTDVIGSVAFGIECNSLEEPENKFRAIGRKAFEPNFLKFILQVMVPHKLLGKLGFNWIPPEVASYFTEVVQDTIRYREQNNVQRKDFMQLMLAMKNQGDKANALTDQEIITESYLFYLAGFETSSTATSFALIELAQNQDIQDKLRHEINDTLRETGGQITYDALMKMEYLDKVMHEALRKYPPLAFIPRQCAKNYKIPGSDVIIEKGTMIHIPAWGIQKDPEYYPNPEEFNPENFSPENKSKRPDFTWVPFGEGPRMCIGLRFGMMQSKVALTTMLQDFRFTPSQKLKWPLEMEKGSAVLTSKEDVYFNVEKL